MTYEDFYNKAAEHDEIMSKCNALNKEFTDFGFFGVIFKGGKNLRQREKLLKESDRIFNELETIRLSLARSPTLLRQMAKTGALG